MRRPLVTLILTLCVIALAGPASASTGPCLGDFDNDNEVGVLDLLFILGAWGPCPQGECVVPFFCNITEPTACENDPSCFCFADMEGAGVCGSDGICDNLDDCPDGNCPPGFICAFFTCCDPAEKCAPDCLASPESARSPVFKYGDHTMRGIAGVDFALTTSTGLECEADLDGDLDVGVLDLLILLGAWGVCP